MRGAKGQSSIRGVKPHPPFRVNRPLVVLRSENQMVMQNAATPSGSNGFRRIVSGGVAFAQPPHPVVSLCSITAPGGVALLNHRLMASTPVGVAMCAIPMGWQLRGPTT